jgi:hypothetical protein
VSEEQKTGVTTATGPGVPDEATKALGAALVKGLQAKPAAGDLDVCDAFALGWQMAQLYRPENLSRPKHSSHDLPGVGSLTGVQRAEILVAQVEAAVVKVKQPLSEAELTPPDLAALQAAVKEPKEQRQAAVLAVHEKLLSVLTAADYRLGTAYGLGRALADTCLKPHDAKTVREELSPYRVANLLGWLDALSSSFPAHAANPVASSLECWQAWAKTADDAAIDAELGQLRQQGRLWRAVLSGEKHATSLLEIDGYLEASRDLAHRLRQIALGAARRFPVLVTVILVLLGVGVWLVVEGSTSSLLGGATSLLVALGLTWKGLGTTVGKLAEHAEQPLWGAAVDTAVSGAITLLPTNDRDHRGRRQIAAAISEGCTRDEES